MGDGRWAIVGLSHSAAPRADTRSLDPDENPPSCLQREQHMAPEDPIAMLLEHAYSVTTATFMLFAVETMLDTHIDVQQRRFREAQARVRQAHVRIDAALHALIEQIER